MDLAREVTALRSSHDWFPDRPNAARKTPVPLRSRTWHVCANFERSLGNDILYSTDSLPDPASLPTLGEMIAAHEELTISARVDNEIQSGNVPLMALTNGLGYL